jgi:phosphatidylserine/phosphatidylglycerophosphate/cardiolipin synthase-like enzyme
MPKKRNTGISLGGLIVVLAIVAIVYLFPAQPPAPAPTALPIPQSQLSSPQPAESVQNSATGQSGNLTVSWLQVFFTNPNPPDNAGNGIDQGVVKDINNARRSIDVTSFDFNLPSFVNALVAASQHGVHVRVVVDGVNGSQTLSAKQAGTSKDFDATKTLQAAGITVVNGGRSSGLMHDKIIIIDGKILYMGSWNMSYNDTYRNNNNILRITNAKLIANYQAKVNELFVDNKFGTHAQVGAQTPKLTIDGVSVENYFSPVDNVMDKLVATVQGAQKSIRFMIFTYTDTNLANAMIDRTQAGIDTEGVIENRGASQGAMVPLFCAKVPVRLDGNKYTMHHKVIVIDDTTVITGSFNFTKSADQENDDNVLIIHNPELAKLYLQEFDRIWGQGSSPDATKISCK